MGRHTFIRRGTHDWGQIFKDYDARAALADRATRLESGNRFVTWREGAPGREITNLGGRREAYRRLAKSRAETGGGRREELRSVT